MRETSDSWSPDKQPLKSATVISPVVRPATQHRSSCPPGFADEKAEAGFGWRRPARTGLSGD